MNSINQVKEWPHNAVVEAIQGKVIKVYPIKTVNTAQGAKTVQNAELQDAGGATIRLVAWSHPDMQPLEGKEVVLHSSRGANGSYGGVKVAHKNYVAKQGPNAGKVVNSVELEVSKLGNFQLVEVYRAQNPGSVAPEAKFPEAATQTPTTPSNSVKTGSTPIYGGTVGAAINNACNSLTARGEELDPGRVYIIASGLVKVALRMESGDLYNSKEKESSNAKDTEDVPF